MTSKAQQIKLDNALVAPENCRVIGKCNMRINSGMKPKEPTYQVALDALALTTCYPAFLITAEVHVIYMHQFWATVIKHKSSYQFKIDKKRFSVNVERKLYHSSVNLVILEKSSTSQMLLFIIYTNRGEPLHPSSTSVFVARHNEICLQICRHSSIWRILPQPITNQSLLDSVTYKTYYAIASGAEPPISRKSQKKSDSAISSKESLSKKKSAKAKKVAAPKPKPTKKKTLVKADRGKGLNVLSEVALSEAAQLKEATKRSKKDFHISQASGSGNGTDFESRVPDEQHLKTTGADEGTKEDEDDDNDSEDKSDDSENEDDGSDGNDDDDDDDDDANDDDNQEGDDTNDDDEKTNSDRTASDIIKTPVQEEEYDDEFNIEEGEKIDDEETMDDEEDDEVTKELYKDVNVNLGNEDTEMINADQGGSEQQNVSQESGFEQVEEDAHVILTPVLDTQKADEPVQSSSVSSNFTSKLLNLENPSPADNEIASLMETSARHAMAVPEITSGFTTTIPPPHIVTNLKKDLSEIKQVDQYAQALSSIPAIVDRYIDNKLKEAINKAIQLNNLDCRQEAQDEKNEYIGLKNVTESLESAVLGRYSSQLKSTYEAAGSLSEFELIKILLDKMEESKSHLRADYKKKLYDTLVESYNTNKDLFNTYGEVFMLKRSRDDKDKDQDPSAGSDRGMKRRKSSKEAESSRDSRSKEKKSSSTSKDASQSQHKHSSKSAHVEEPSHTIDDLGVQRDQEFDTCNNDEQPVDKEVSKAEWQTVSVRSQQTSPIDSRSSRPSSYPSGFLHQQRPGISKRRRFKKTDVYSRKQIIAVTRLTIMKKYDYGHLEEIEVRREDQKLYKFREGDFP
ncbi:hypothetical protein Tco_0575233 [Tanacetum coccineum]